MADSILSFKKRFILALLFGGFFLVLIVLSIFIKKTPLTAPPTPISPTLVPVEVSGTPQEKSSPIKIEPAPAVENNELGTIKFSYQSKNVPNSGTVYTQAPTSIPTDVVARIQEKLIAGGQERILNTPKGQVIFMQKDSKTLTIYLYSRTISYSDSSPQASTPQNTSSLLKRAADFIASLNLPYDNTSGSATYFNEKEGDLVPSNDPNADLIDISFKEAVQGLTVYRQFGSNASTHVWFSKAGGIKKFTYFYTPQYVPQKSVILPTLNEAERMILDKKGIIVGLGRDYQQPPVKSISSTTFTSVEVAYFNNGVDTLLYPIFVFKGTSLTDQSSPLPVTIYLQAVN